MSLLGTVYSRILRGGGEDAVPPAQFSIFSCIFRKKIGRIIGWKPPLGLATLGKSWICH